jgi:hypothetical protein
MYQKHSDSIRSGCYLGRMSKSCCDAVKKPWRWHPATTFVSYPSASAIPVKPYWLCWRIYRFAPRRRIAVWSMPLPLYLRIRMVAEPAFPLLVLTKKKR